MSKSYIELCSMCANECGTINNMQELIIPLMNDEIQEAKDIIWVLFKSNQSYRGAPHTKEDDVVKSFKQRIIENTRAIRAFYERFPELPRKNGLKRYTKSDYGYPRKIK